MNIRVQILTSCQLRQTNTLKISLNGRIRKLIQQMLNDLNKMATTAKTRNVSVIMDFVASGKWKICRSVGGNCLQQFQSVT